MKNGQAALEFLMTYGWMMIVLIGLIAGLAYFMPHPNSLTINKCIFGSAMPCLGVELDAGNLTVVLRNSLGSAVYNVSAAITSPYNISCVVSNKTIITDQRLTIKCRNSGVMNISSDSRFKMVVTYRKTWDGYAQSILGDIYAKAK